jgi:hypothetical protein
VLPVADVQHRREGFGERGGRATDRVVGLDGGEQRLDPGDRHNPVPHVDGQLHHHFPAVTGAE